MGLILGVLAAVAGALLAPAARRWWEEDHRAWWEREVVPRLVRLGWGRLTGQHRVPALTTILLAVAGASSAGAAGAALGAVAGAVGAMCLPALLDAHIAARRDRADEQLTRVLPELASAIGRGEGADLLLDRMVRLVSGADGQDRFDPLVIDLLRRAAAAARFAPRVPHVCAVLSGSELPTARLVAVAWRQVGLGVDVPSAIRAICRAAQDDHALREEIRARVDPIHRQARLMLLLPVGLLGLLVLQDPSMGPRLLRFPALGGLLASVLVTALAWAFLRSALARLT